MVSTFKSFSRNLSDQFPVLYQNRYCDQEEFSIGVFSDDFYSRNFSKCRPFLLNSFDTKMYLPSLPVPKYGCKAVSSGSDIYVLGQFKNHKSPSVFKYSFSTKTWGKLPVLEEVNSCSYLCSFMQKLFIISTTAYKKACFTGKLTYIKNFPAWVRTSNNFLVVY